MAGSADARTGDAGAGDPAAAAGLARLFGRSCFRHAGDRDALRAWLRAAAFRPTGGIEADRLLVRPGLAFLAPGGTGHPMVLSFDDGWCGDAATGIDPQVLTLRLRDEMGRRRTSMQLMGVDQAGQEQRYLLLRPKPAVPVVLLVMLHDAAGGSAQASLFAAPLPPKGAP